MKWLSSLKPEPGMHALSDVVTGCSPVTMECPKQLPIV